MKNFKKHLKGFTLVELIIIMKNFKKHLKGFTLVELIIVITILAILATIGFVSFQNFTKDARDGNRATTMMQIKKGLELTQVQTGQYPQPEGNVLSGSINNQILTYVGEIGENISRIIRMNKTPTDPLTQTNLIYGTTSDNKYYQIATIMENPTSYNGFITQTYADSFLQANVEGNYPGYIIFSSGSELWIANIPSLIFNNTGSVNLLSSGTYFVVNKKTNLPYQINSTTQMQNLTPNNLIQEITKSSNATLTGVNISNLSKDNFNTYFSGTILESFNINGQDITNTGTILETLKTSILGTSSTTAVITYNNCTLSGETINHGNSITAYSENNIVWNASYDCIDRSQVRTCNDGILSGSGTYGYNSCVKGTVNNCSASGSYVYNTHTYSIPALNHGSGAANLLSSNVSENNGTFKYTLTTIECNDGVFINANESATPTIQSCNSGFGINGNICSASQNGACNNSIALGCSIGSAINDNGATTCGTTRTWNCSGLYGGTISTQCSFANPSCQANPTNLSLSHSTRSKTFTFSWTAGVGNGGSCKLQYNKNGTWTNISETTYNCDTTLSNQSVTLPGDGWYSGNWNGVQVKVIRTSDSITLGSPFTQTLSCSTTSASSSSTPTIDEDCNGVWDNYTTNAVTRNGTTSCTRYNNSSYPGYSCMCYNGYGGSSCGASSPCYSLTNISGQVLPCGTVSCTQVPQYYWSCLCNIQGGSQCPTTSLSSCSGHTYDKTGESCYHNYTNYNYY